MESLDHLVGRLERPENAYFLGVVAASGRTSKDVLEVPLRERESVLLSLLEGAASAVVPVSHEVRDGVLRIGAPQAVLCASFLGAPPGDPSLGVPELRPDLAFDFLRGVFDAKGRIASPKSGSLVLRLHLRSTALRAFVEASFSGLFSPGGPDELVAYGTAALDILGKLYDRFVTEKVGLARAKHVRRYAKWCRAIAGLVASREPAEILVQRLRPDAVLPGKERVSDSGYDLTLLYEAKRVGDVVLYGTGLVVAPPGGWYFDVVPRSSIIKRGYVSANSVGIIDRAYRGELLVPLIKLDDSAPDLELPARVMQMILRPVVHFPVRELGELDTTARGAGGFGSTG